MGTTLARKRRPRPRRRASPSPRVSTIHCSWVPVASTGTIGARLCSASLMKPVCPASSTLWRSLHGRYVSMSEPG